MANVSSKGSPLHRSFTFLLNKGRNAVRERPILAAFGCVLFAYALGVFAFPSLPKEEEIVLVQSKDLPFETLKDVAIFLRARDSRVVRPSPSDKTGKRQNSEACGMYLEQAYQVLAKPRGVHRESDLVDAINVVSLCTTNRPNHRVKLTTVAPTNVPATIVSLLSFPHSSYTAMAAASECIWISSFSSKENHDAFVKAGAVDNLSKVITNHDCQTLKATKERVIQCSLAQMWAAAALQNLAAAYCETKWGGCDWEWNGNMMSEDDERHEIAIDEGSKVKFDPETVRLSMIRNTKLLKALEKMICDNLKELDKAPSERTWPSRAKVTDVEISPSVATWGAIGAVKNLALSPEFYKQMPSNMQACLCDHAVRSPDWLEYTKAKDAIYRLGHKREDVCEPWFDRKMCSDRKSWVDSEGNSCETYEKKRWCAEYRDYAPPEEELPNGKKYTTAGRACCVCGGGKEKNKG